MADNEAEKRDIAELDFDISKAITSLNKVDERIQQLNENTNKKFKQMQESFNSIFSTKGNYKEIKGFSQKRIEQIAKLNAETEKINAQSVLQYQKSENKKLEVAKSTYSKVADYAKTYLLYQGFNELKNAAKEVINEMVNVEYQMVQIGRVLNEESLNINNYRDKLIQLAYDYGNSFDNVADITLRLAQAGFDSTESLKLTESTLLALNTAELNATEATSDMVAVMSQWNLMTGDATQEAKDYASIIDKINKVADNFPTTSADILNALKKTSSAFNLAGASIDETIALITTAEIASQRGGKAIGTAMNNIILQLKDAKKIDIMEGLGIDLYTNEAKTEFKSIVDIITQLSARMQELKSAGKENTKEMQELLSVFTIFRRNIGAGLLSGVAGEDSTYSKVLETSMNSLGYSISENEKHMKTAKAAMEQFNAELLKLKTEVWDGGLENVFRSLLLLGGDVTKVLRTLVNTFGALPTAISVATTAFTAYNAIQKKTIDKGGFQIIGSDFFDKIKKAEADVRALKQTMDGNIVTNHQYSQSFKDYVNNIGTANVSVKGYISSLIKQKAATIGVQVATIALNTALTLGLSAAISLVIKGLDEIIITLDEANESMDKMNGLIKGEETSINETIDKFKQLKNEMNSGNLTQEEYLSNEKELLEMQNELKEKYQGEASSINLVTGSIKEQEQALRDLMQVKYNQYIQENQKEINKTAKILNEELGKTFALTANEKLGKELINKFPNIFKEELFNNVQMHENQKPIEMLETYREIYDTISEFRKNAKEEDLEYANEALEQVSTRISTLKKEYGESYDNYVEYLNNKLKYDENYSENYNKILKAREELNKAVLNEDEKAIEESQKKISELYSKALSQAEKDPDAALEMTKIIQEELDNVNKYIESEKIKLKLTADEDYLKDQIQKIMSDLGDISDEDFKDILNSNENTENISKLKEILDEANISLEDFANSYEYAGLKLEEVNEEVISSKDIYNDYIGEISKLSSEFDMISKAADEFNQYGSISATTFKNVADNNLIEYLDIVNGKMAINKEHFERAAEAERKKIEADLQEQAVTRIIDIVIADLNGTLQETKGASDTATVGINNAAQAALDATNNFLKGAIGASEFRNELNKLGGKQVGEFTGLSKQAMEMIQGVSSEISSSLNLVKSLQGSVTNLSKGASAGSKSATKTFEEESSKRVQAFKKEIDDLEKLEQSWVNKYKKLEMFSTSDLKFITHQRINRYNEYLNQINQLTGISEEDRNSLIREYSAERQEAELEYFDLLKQQLDDQIKAYKEANTERINQIKDQAQAQIDALKKVEGENDRIREKEEYERKRDELIHGNQGIEYWEQRTGREAQIALAEAKKELAELDRDWEEKKEKWNLDDQVKQIEDARDAQIKAIEDAQETQIKAWQEAYRKQVELYAETGQIIYDHSVISAGYLYNAYMENFVTPFHTQLSNVISSLNSNIAATTNNINNAINKANELASKTGGTYTETFIGPKPIEVTGLPSWNQVKQTASKIYETKTNPYGLGTSSNISLRKKILKFHGGGETTGNREGLALLRPNEVILKPQWADDFKSMISEFKKNKNIINNNGNNTTNKIDIDGNLINIDANIKNKDDADYLNKQIEKKVKELFNIKK